MTTTITARVDADKKRQAEEIFDDIGLTLSGAINVPEIVKATWFASEADVFN